MPSNVSLYGSSATNGNVTSNNFTTLYSPSAGVVRTQLPYGNANVVSLLNIGTDGGNTVNNIVATGNITIGNITANGNVTADYFIGNFIGNSTNANFANYAGNVTVAAQPNITSVGNLVSLTVQNPNTSATDQVVFNFNTVETAPSYLNQGIEFSLYANAANSEFNNTESYIRYRGTPASPTAAGDSDLIQKTVSYAWDGGKVLRAAQWSTLVTNVSPSSNASGFTGGAVSFETGNPYGDVANTSGTNSSSFRNTLSFGDIGQLALTQGNRPDTGATAQIQLIGYGRNSANPNIAGGINFLRAEGNRQANLSVQPSDEIYRIGAVPYNGSAFSAGPANGFSIAAITGNGYVANSANVPIDFRIRVVDSNNFASNSWFYNDGTVSLANSTTINGNLTVTGNSNLGSNSNVFISGGSANFVLSTDGAGNLSWANIGNGSVANANYANFANVANVANSVAVANVVGIGNIATINLDGSSSNVLYGNGVFATVVIPSGTSISNGTSNVNIPVANGNVNVSTNGNANIAQFDTNGGLFLYPTTSSTNGIRITSFGNPISGDVSRIAVSRARGNATTPLSVQPNDNIMRFLAFAYNGAGYQTSSTGSIRAVVDSSYTSNGANIPIGWNMSVNDTLGGTTNQPRVHNFYSNGNVQFSNTVFATDSFTAGGNITSNTGLFIGNGGGLSNIAVGNITGLGNIATINLDGNASNVLLGNGVFSSVPSTTPTSIANGTSNITIPVASSNILISTAGNANIIDIRADGFTQLKPPAQGPLNALRIDTYGRSGNVGAQRINSTRYRGNATTPLSVEPNDATMELLTVAYNGSIIQTSSIARIQSIVDSSYTANAANIPIGWQLQVNDTNGGVNNQTKTHNFYSNGTVNFANSISVSGNGNISGTILSVTGNATSGNLTTGNIVATGGNYNFSNSTGGKTILYLGGDKTPNSNFDMYDMQFGVTMNNVDTTTGFSPFRFQQYAPNNSRFGPMYYYRSRGNDFFSSAPVVAGDQVMSYNFLVNSNNTTVSIGQINSNVSYNDNAGNVGTQLDLNCIGSGTTGYLNGVINLLANTTNANNFSASNVSLSRFQETVYSIGSTSGTITPDFNNGSIQNMTLTGNITMNSLGNAIAGRSMTLILTVGGTGSYTLTSSMKFLNGYKTLSSGVGAIDIISVFYDGGTYYASLTNGYS
jgi:hypothetical protein